MPVSEEQYAESQASAGSYTVGPRRFGVMPRTGFLGNGEEWPPLASQPRGQERRRDRLAGRSIRRSHGELGVHADQWVWAGTWDT